MIRFDLQTDLRSIFRQLGKTTILVTHDLAEAAYFADRVVLLRDGRIAQQGAIRELLEQPSEPFVERFVRAQRSHLDGPEAHDL
jgi:osmoprotectant transport system ATP-binding protein